MKRLLSVVMLVYFPFLLFAQRSLPGQVVNRSTSEPLEGVTISNGSQVTTSDAQGKFMINASTGDVVRFTYVGFESFSITVNAETGFLSVQLEPSSEMMDEVVTTGYTKERKKDLTGAVTVVKVDQMNKQAVGNAMKALQGQIPGVYITTDGSPRGPATVRIRGIGTLNNNDPLYIIDGVPTKSGLHTINQWDIESMQVLRDASAASIYGAQAANGVIVITTKRGKKGETQVNFNAYTSASRYLTKVDMLDTEGYGRSLWQAYVNAGSNPNSTTLPFNFTYHTDPQSGRPVLDKIETPEYIDAAQTLRTSNTKWFDEISKTGLIQSYDLSLSRGGESGSSLFSASYFKNDGIIRRSGFTRISLRFNSEYSFLNDILTVGENFNIVSLNEVGAVPVNEAIQAVPMIPVRTADGLGWGGPSTGMNDRQNPVRIIEDNKQNNDLYTRMLGNIYAQVKLWNALTIKTNFGLDYGQDYARNWQKPFKSGYLENPLSKLTMSQWHALRTIWTNTIDYAKKFAGKHTVNIFGGMEYNLYRYSTFWSSREEYINQNEEYMWLNSGSGLKDNGGSGAKNVLLSYFGKFNYNFDGKYMASFTIRHDGSSRFGTNNRFGTFPAFSLGWQLGRENFVRNLNIFQDLKLRYSWGVNGNQEIDNHAIFDVYAPNYNTAAYDIDGAGSGVLPSGYVLTQMANPNLRWESTTQSNFGLDFALPNQVLYGSVDYFMKRTEDILISPSYIAVLGEGGRQFRNGASMENSGWEIQLGNQTRVSQDLSFNVDLNLSFIKNKVTHLPDAVVNSYGGDARIGQNILGRTLGSFYGYVADGIFKSQEEVDAHATQPGKGVGRIRFADLNKDGVVNDYDRTWIGVPVPDFTYGLSAGVRYKRFDLSIFFQGVHGVDIDNTVKRWTDFWSVTNAGSNKGARLLDAWSPENPNSTIPAVALTDANNEARLSTYYVEDGSYMKIRNLQLGYQWQPRIAVGKVSVKSLRIYLNADNLALVYKNKGFTGVDPESPAYGYPNPLVLTAGVNVKL